MQIVRCVLFRFVFLLFVSCFVLRVSAKIEGFYCDVFQDEGTKINGGDLEKDCEYIGFSQEHLNTEDSTFEKTIMVKSDKDANGYLLYPDGLPRYAIVYYHGGFMSHAEILGETGRQLVRTHYFNGGCQFGSCAGSYMLASNTKWFNIWPGKMDGPNVSSTPLDKIINEGSPLIGYNNFKAGDVVTKVFHNNGGSVDTTKKPAGTLILAMHNSGTLKGYADIWSWKHHDSTGRVVGLTGHPEGNSAQDQIRYISAVMLYLRNCLGVARVKHILKNNAAITMDKKWEDKNPLYTMIGDKQYHHFVLECKSAQKLTITLNGKEGFDFHLFVAKDTFAYNYKAQYADTSKGASKTLTIPNLASAGKWYVGVKLNTTVTTTTSKDFPQYGGSTEVLNGIPYTIKATWDGAGILADELSIRNSIAAITHNRSVIVNVGTAKIQSLRVYDLKGRVCWQPLISDKFTHYTWLPQSTGLYVIHISTPTSTLIKHISFVK